MFICKLGLEPCFYKRTRKIKLRFRENKRQKLHILSIPSSIHNFVCLYSGPSPFGHDPELMSIGHYWNKDLKVKLEFCFLAQRAHNDGHLTHLPVNLTL